MRNRAGVRVAAFAGGGALGIGVGDLLAAREWVWAGLGIVALVLVTFAYYALAGWGKDGSGPA
jgi:hypothetical protein